MVFSVLNFSYLVFGDLGVVKVNQPTWFSCDIHIKGDDLFTSLVRRLSVHEANVLAGEKVTFMHDWL